MAEKTEFQGQLLSVHHKGYHLLATVNFQGPDNANFNKEYDVTAMSPAALDSLIADECKAFNGTPKTPLADWKKAVAEAVPINAKKQDPAPKPSKL